MSRTVTTLVVAFALAAAAGGSATAADSIASPDSYFPAADIKGASGTWRTDVWIFNPETVAQNTVDLFFTEAGDDGTVDYVSLRVGPLAPRESVVLDDVLRKYFQKTSTYGLVQVQAEYPVLVTSNTYNIAGAQAGTYGTYSPGQPYRNALGYDDSAFGDLYITGLTNEPYLMTNAVVMNPTDLPLEAGIQLFDANGNQHVDGSTRVYTVPPFSVYQMNDIFGTEFRSNLPPGPGPFRLSMFVNLGNGARILGYATVTDKRTGDPFLIPAQAMRP